MLSRNRMNVDQQWRLLELVAANVDILITDTDPETDEQHREARTEFWKIATKVLNQLGESAGKYKDIGGWRKAWRDMKSHLRGKLLQLQLRQEDAANNPVAFAQQLEAAALSPVEMKTYAICGNRIFDVSPKIRYQGSDVQCAGNRYVHAHVNGKEYRFPIRKRDVRVRVRNRRQKPSVQTAKGSQASAKTSILLQQGAPKSESLAKNAGSSQSAEVLINTKSEHGIMGAENLAARRTKRENAGKRGGVASKYKFNEERIFFNQRLPSPSKRKMLLATPRTASVDAGAVDTKSSIRASDWLLPLTEPNGDSLNPMSEVARRHTDSLKTEKCLENADSSQALQKSLPSRSTSSRRLKPSHNVRADSTSAAGAVNAIAVPPPKRRRVARETDPTLTRFDVRSIDTFCRSIGNQLKELPADKVADVVTDIQNLVWNRTMLLKNDDAPDQTVDPDAKGKDIKNEILDSIVGTGDNQYSVVFLDTPRPAKIESPNVPTAQTTNACVAQTPIDTPPSTAEELENTSNALSANEPAPKELSPPDAEQVAFDGIASAVTTLGDSVVQLSVALQELRQFSKTRTN